MLPLRNKKAQGNLETLILIGGAVLIAVIVITIVTSLGGSSRNDISDKSDKISKSKDMPFAPNVVSVDARYSDCVNSKTNAVLRFSWKPISNEGTFRLIIENTKNEPIGNLDYLVSNNSEPQDMNNLNPNITQDLLVSEINIGTTSCGDTYFLSIEVEKNNQTQISSKYPFRWNKQGDPTVVVYRPSFDPAPGSYNVSQFPLTVQLNVPDPTGYILYYTTDGSTPTTSSLIYNGVGVSINVGQTIMAISDNSGLVSSAASGTYIASYYTVEDPIATPGDSINLTNPVSVSLSLSTSGADIYYTLDGSNPECSGPTGTLYSSPISVSTDTTLKSIGCRASYISSSVVTNTYTFFVPLDPLTITPPGGSYTSIQSVVITSTNAGAVIHYTLTGIDPTVFSPIYSGPISISSNTVLKATGFVGAFESPMSTETYNITLPAVAPVLLPASGTYPVDQSILMSSTTPMPYTIRYTTDGSDPISTSALYVAPVLININSILKAKSFKVGWSDSPTTTATYNFALSGPTFNPLPGAYSNAQTIQLNAAAGSQIRYTLDGSNPTQTTGTLINAGESTTSITTSTTIKAISFKTGWSSSSVSSGLFTINDPAATPVFSPNGGTHTNSVSVTISCSTPSSTIRYTDDGTDPTNTVGTVYSSALTLTSTTTLKAVCYATGYSTSSVSSALFTVNLIALAPTITPNGGNFSSVTSALLSTLTPLPYTIRYTTDGSDPTATSTNYTGSPVLLNGNTTLKAAVYKTGYNVSPITSGVFNFAYATPTFNPTAPSNHADSVSVQINASAGALIRYTLDGSNPTQTTGTQILAGESTIPITSSSTLKAIAYRSGWTSSPIASGVYTINAPSATPVFSPNGGTHTNSVSVTISCSTPSSTIRYTNNGTDPTSTTGTIYSSALTLTSTTTLKAVCYASGYSTSSVSSALFTVNLIALAPTITPNGGNFSSTTSALLSTLTPLPYTIRYTTNGSDPTATSTSYTGSPVLLNGNTTLKAAVYKTGYNVSPITSGVFNFAYTAPTFNPTAPSNHADSISVQINAPAGALIRYTLDGSNPTQTTGTQILAGQFTSSITSTSALKAIAYRSGWTSSPIASGVYTINAPASTPVFSPNGGTFTNSVSVTISCSTPSSTIRYTTDGTNPTQSIGTIYSSALTLTTSGTLKSVCYASGYSTSSVASSAFTINVAPTAVIVIGGGTFCGSATLTATGGTGGVIYYQGTTSNGTSITTPSTSQVVSTTGTYYFRARSTAGVWGSQGSASVTINPTAIAPTLISGTTNVCSGTNTTLTATGGTGTGYQWYAGGTGTGYQWYAGGCGSGSVLSTTSSLTVSPTSNTTYFVRNTSPCGASSCISKQVTVTAPPVVTVTPATNCGSGNVTLSATTSQGTINWYSSSTGGAPVHVGSTYTVYLSSTTTFYVGVTGASCTLSTRVPVTGTIAPFPSAVTVTSSVYGDCGEGYQLTSSGGSGGTRYYQGTTSNGTSTATTSSPIITASGTYYFRSRSSYGCWGPQGSVSVNYIPPVVVFNQPSFYSLSGWTVPSGSTNVSFGGGAVYLTTWYQSPLYFYKGNYTYNSSMIEAVVQPGSSMHRAGILFNTLNMSNTYLAEMYNYYASSGFYLKYNGSSLGYSPYPPASAWDFSGKLRFNIKIFTGGAVKKAKFWLMGSSEPAAWSITTLNSSRTSGAVGGYIGNGYGKIYSIKLTQCS